MIYTIPFLALILLISVDMRNSLAQEFGNDPQPQNNTENTQGNSTSGALDNEPAEIEEPYTLQEIAHAFETLQPHAVFDENQHLTFHSNSTTYDPIVTDRDLEIGHDFAMYSDAVMDQVDIWNNSQYDWQPLEPNPQLLDYRPPSWWWSLYTAWWHDWNNDKTPQDPPSNYINPPM